jgi:hypothetical protein
MLEFFHFLGCIIVGAIIGWFIAVIIVELFYKVKDYFMFREKGGRK